MLRADVRAALHFALLLGGVACREEQPVRTAPDSSGASAGLMAAPVVREPTVVAFWLPSSDTLGQGSGADLLDDFRSYTQLVAPLLEERGILLTVTNADSIVVELGGGPRRVIMLAGLDYPFGYVLVEPGFAESILTGVSTDDELLQEVDWYFGLEEEGEEGRDSRPPQARRTVARVGYLPSTSRTRASSTGGANGFWRNAVFGSRRPWGRMASSL